MKVWTITADTTHHGWIEEVVYSEAAANARCTEIFAPIWKKHRGDATQPTDWRAGYESIYNDLEDWIGVTEHDISDHPGLTAHCLVIVDETNEIGVSLHPSAEDAREGLMSDLYECYQDYDLPDDSSDAAICSFLSHNKIKMLYSIQPLALGRIPLPEASPIEAMIDAECRKLGITQRPTKRSDLFGIPEVCALGTDTSGLPLAYRNSYHCADCNTGWVDTWSCAVDDECSCCGSSISPEASELLIPEAVQPLFELLPE